MCLGTFVTLAQRPCENYTMIIIENGTYEVTGNQKLPGVGKMDFEAIARGSGIENVVTVETEEEFEEHLPWVFTETGPAVFIWKVEPGDEGVPSFEMSIADRAARLKKALAK
jgi:thiamine pyrophosphate-dependent acetolactate synthase large subunit-like protein